MFTPFMLINSDIIINYAMKCFISLKDKISREKNIYDEV